jgi:hypothetical protein
LKSIEYASLVLAVSTTRSRGTVMPRRRKSPTTASRADGRQNGSGA